METKNESNKGKEKNQIGLLGAVSYIVGMMIGSGIFVTPGGILKHTGSVGMSLIVWVGSGLFGTKTSLTFLALNGAFCYIELGTSICESGADFAYMCYYKWYPIAFAFQWMNTLLYSPCSTAIMAETVGAYVLEALSPILCIQPEAASLPNKLIGFLLLWVLAWINFYEINKYAAKFQIFVSIGKIVALSIVIFTGAYFLIFKGWQTGFQNIMEGTSTSPASLTLAFYSGLWAYEGWDTLNYGMEDVKSPRKTVPLAVVSGTVLVMLVYLATNVAYFIVLSKQEFLASTAVAEAFSLKVLGGFAYFVPVIVTVVMIGAVNCMLFSTGRFMFAAGRRGHLPKYLSLLHPETSSPRPAIASHVVLVMALSFIGDLEELINYVVFVGWLQRAFTISGFIWLRIGKIPLHDGAYRIPLVFHVTFLCICVVLVVVPIYQNPLIAAVGLGVIASGFLVYFPLVYPKKIPKCFTFLNERLTEICQVLFIGLPECMEENIKSNQVAEVEKCK